MFLSIQHNTTNKTKTTNAQTRQQHKQPTHRQHTTQTTGHRIRGVRQAVTRCCGQTTSGRDTTNRFSLGSCFLLYAVRGLRLFVLLMCFPSFSGADDGQERLIGRCVKQQTTNDNKPNKQNRDAYQSDAPELKNTFSPLIGSVRGGVGRYQQHTQHADTEDRAHKHTRNFSSHIRSRPDMDDPLENPVETPSPNRMFRLFVCSVS